MAKVRVNWPIVESMKKKSIVDRTTASKVGKAVVGESKDFISKGFSPVRGNGRFKAYAAQRNQGEGPYYPDTVKGKYPSKRTRPVNLKLSGEMLNHLKWWTDRRGNIAVGLSSTSGRKTNVPRRVRDKFEAHNEGTLKSKNVPQRMIVPTGRNDTYASSIMRRVRGVIEKRVNELVRRSNKS